MNWDAGKLSHSVSQWGTSDWDSNGTAIGTVLSVTGTAMGQAGTRAVEGLGHLTPIGVPCPTRPTPVPQPRSLIRACVRGDWCQLGVLVGDLRSTCPSSCPSASSHSGVSATRCTCWVGQDHVAADVSATHYPFAPTPPAPVAPERASHAPTPAPIRRGGRVSSEGPIELEPAPASAPSHTNLRTCVVRVPEHIWRNR